MLPGICNQTSRIRKCSERFPELKVKREPISSLMILTGFLICGRSNALRSARTNALSWQIVFPWLSESFATGLPLHSTNLMTIFRGFTRGYRRSGESQYQNLIARGKRSGGIAQPLCVNPDCQRKPAFYSVDQFPAFHNVQWLFTPFNGSPESWRRP